MDGGADRRRLHEVPGHCSPYALSPPMHVESLFCMLAATMILASPAAKGDEAVQRAFDELAEEVWQFDMREDPLGATQVGDHRFNDQLPSVAPADYERRLAARREFLKRLEAIDRDKLDREGQVNCEIFDRLMRDEIAELEFQTWLIPITSRWGFHTSFPELPKRVPLASVKDYENYIARLNAFGRFTDQHIELMRLGIRRKMLLPDVVLVGYEETIRPHIVDNPAESLLFEPFAAFPSSVPERDRARLAEAGREAIRRSVVPAFRRFLEFMQREYVPAAPNLIGASVLPNGRELYRHRVRSYTTLDITPEQVHQIGLDEVKRIRGEMEGVVRRAGFEGSLAEFIHFLRTDPRFYAETPEQLMKEVAYVLKRMDGELPKLFGRLPRAPYGLRRVPDYTAPRTTTAYYSPPPGDGSDAGYYYVNTFNLKSRPLYEVEALSLHEAVPGHHLQLALQQELTDLPKFRRFAGFTVFVEGWALYAERLGLEVGFYQDPYSDFGRLTYEMWRACRLVVDTGMHYFGWTRQRAIDFMAANTALSLHNITAEVDRYISWPGQALAYKTGELKIRQLRTMAERELGARFNVREFHDVVLAGGSVPLDILEANVRQYLSDVQGRGEAAGADQPDAARPGPLTYPATRKADVVDDHHGTKVPDPYRWLEDPDSDETRAWVEAQNKVTFGYLEKIPHRDWFRKRLEHLWNYERFGIPWQRGQRFFFEHNSGLQNQSVLYHADSPDAAQLKTLIDPNTLSADGTVSLAGYAASEDGRLLAYGISHGGSDWRQWRVRNVETGEDFPEVLEWVKFSGASWTPDGKGFFYSRYDEPPEGNKLVSANYFQKLYYHRLGTPQSDDVLVYHRPDQKEWGFGGSVTEDGRYLVIHVWQGTDPKNNVFYKDLSRPDAPVVELLNQFDADYSFLGNDGTRFYFFTDLEAPRGRIIAIDLDRPQREHWQQLVGQTAETLHGASLAGDYLLLTYLKDAYDVVRVHDLAGKHVRDVDLPGIGSVGGFGGRRKDKETFYAFTSFTTPTTIFRYDLATGQSTPLRKPKVDFDPDAFETKQVFVASKDGTRVPMFITHKKGITLDGRNPTLLYAYGGFNASIQPAFSVSNVVWMEAGGVHAVANLRGGGEYGREWHEAGRRERKQNVFDDFIAAAEWLVENKYTSPERLAIEGRSNGGLLVGAVMTQRPDLFAVALPAVGVMDMLRFHKFTIGWAWVPEYGSADHANDFQVLHRYSPLHNLRPGVRYPATLVTTADHDDRVVPAHSYKFAAALQAAQAGQAPVLIRIDTRAGHGAGKPTKMRIEEISDLLGFTLQELGVRPPNE
jgi:prolyl oligopeptidase